MQCALRESQDVLRKLRDKSDPDNQDMLDTALAHLDFCLGKSDGPPRPCRQARRERTRERLGRSQELVERSSQRFLGQASDVSFFNAVRRVIRNNQEQQDVLPHLESYEREGADADLIGSEVALILPDHNVSDRLVDVYFSTIHIAYPFICRQQFLRDYRSFREQRPDVHAEISFKPLLCMSDAAFHFTGTWTDDPSDNPRNWIFLYQLYIAGRTR